MLKVFDRSLHGREAAHHLVALRQRERTVSDYAIEFRTLAVACGWNPAVQTEIFLNGLSEYIEDEIYTQCLPEGFDALVDLALQVDNKIGRASCRERV